MPIFGGMVEHVWVLWNTCQYLEEMGMNEDFPGVHSRMLCLDRAIAI